jgi:hypothetical protein
MGRKAGVGHMTDPGSVTIDKKLVRYLREGVRDELIANTWDLQAQLETTIEPEAFRGILACFDASRSLFEFVEFVRRLQDAAVGSYILLLRDVPVLGSLLSEIRQKTGAPPRPRQREESFLQQFARRPQRRRRGDGS